jgi:hypothetical protein
MAPFSLFEAADNPLKAALTQRLSLPAICWPLWWQAGKGFSQRKLK